MGFFKKIGHKLHKAKKFANRRIHQGATFAMKAGRVASSAGKTMQVVGGIATTAGMVTGNPQLMAGGAALQGTGMAFETGGRALRQTGKGVEKLRKEGHTEEGRQSATRSMQKGIAGGQSLMA